MRASACLIPAVAVSVALSTGCAVEAPEATGPAPPTAALQLTRTDTVLEANPAFSPDGRWILFESDAAGNRDIWRLPAGGGAAERLTHHPSFDSAPAWTPDGRAFVFESDRSGCLGLWRRELAEGAAPVALTDGRGQDGSPAVSPDGRLVAFESNRDKGRGTDLWVIGVDGGGLRRVTATPAGVYHRSADWSPDGLELLCESDREGGGPALYRIDVASGAALRVTPLSGYEGHPAWSPDGTAIAFEATWGGRSRIHVMGPGGEHPRAVTAPDAFWPRWSPDGRSLVYCVWASAGANIWTANIE